MMTEKDAAVHSAGQLDRDADAVFAVWREYAGRDVDAFDGLLVPVLLTPAGHLLVQSVRIQAGNDVLDLGGGSGAVAECVIPIVGAAGHVVVVDSDAQMLAHAAKRVPAAELIKADAASIPLPDSSFHVTFCQQALQFFADLPAALREAFRLLRPDGQLALSVWCPIEDQPIYLQVRAVLARYVGEEVAASFFAAPSKVGGPDNLRHLLEDAGFVDVSVRRQDFSVELVSAADFLVRYGAQSILVELLLPLGEERCRSALRDLLAGLSNTSPDLPFTLVMPFYLATASVDAMMPQS